MPELIPFTTGPVPVLNLSAAAEQSAIIACLYAGAPNGYDAIIGPLAPPATNRVLWFDNPTNTRVRAAVCVQPGHLYIAFGGTHEFLQWPRHLTGAVSARYQGPDGAPIEGIGVHGFHQAVARGMWDVIVPTFPADWMTREIRIAGHSLGGSCAQLVAWRMAQIGLGPRVQTITFGAPRCILGWYKGPRPAHEWRVTNVNDVVPHLPFPYTAFWVGGVQAIFAMRGGPRKAEGALQQSHNPGSSEIWLHYGPEYVISDNGLVYVHPEFIRARLQDPIHKVASRTRTTHLILAYMQRGGSSLVQYGGLHQAREALEVGVEAIENPPNAAPAVVAPILEGAELDWSNLQIVDPPGAPLTAITARKVVATVLESIGVGGSDSVLKDTVLGEGMSSIWDLTLFVNNDIYGTSNTVALNGATEAQARATLLEFASFRKALLGNDKVDNPASEFAISQGRSSPAIEFARIRDTVNPRVGDVYPLTLVQGMPFPSNAGPIVTKQNAADPMFVSVNLSLRATSGNVVKRYTLKIAGVPDKVVSLGSYDGTETVGNGGSTFNERLRDLVNFLTDAAGASLGVSGLDPSTEKPISAWAPDPVDGRAIVTITGHGYQDGDQIRITRTGWWYLNRTWAVDFIDANKVALRRSQITLAQVPKSKGRANREVLASGVRQTTFYRFDRPSWMSGVPLPALPVRITRKRPGPKFVPVSFRGNRKAIKA